MITATCGLGLLSLESVAESFAMAHRVGKLIHALAGAPQPFLESQPIVASEPSGS